MLKTIKAELLAKLDVKKILPVFRKFFSRNSRYEKPLIKFYRLKGILLRLEREIEWSEITIATKV